MSIGVLISNLGSPEGPTPEQVGPYLKEFLMDPHVIDIPFIFRWPLVNWLIIPKRKIASADLYKKIWKPSGSPLVQHTRDLAAKVSQRLGPQYLVEIGMRYGRPSLREALMNLKRSGVEKIIVSPQYPQYALSSYESTRTRVLEVARELHMENKVQFIPPFFKAPEFLDPWVSLISDVLKSDQFEHLLFSYHGLPERHVQKTESERGHCLSSPHCCDEITDANKNCYRAQSYWTTRELARRLNLKSDFYSTGFQSRLTSRWIRPYSDEMITQLAKKGVKRLAVVCPSFTVDCLETLEEVGMRFSESFREAGGEKLRLVPCLNSLDIWAEGLSCMLRSEVR